jgi:phospholipid/cholesterol/gamma-HCH transport system substrate-binding protein
MEFVRGWALATNAKDGLSHYFRAGLVLTEYSVTGLLPGGIPAGAATPKASTRTGTSKSPTTPKGGLANVVPDLLDGVGELLGSLLSPKTDRTGGVTGLTPRQETNALSFLLGGS